MSLNKHWLLWILVCLNLSPLCLGHEHHTSALPENSYISDAPVDSILVVHIIFMLLAFGIIFPIGMVLGLGKNRFHVPVQTLGTILAIVGYFLGHHHKGREFAPNNIHSRFVPVIKFFFFLQIFFGIFLKLHIVKGGITIKRLNKVFKFLHGLIGKFVLPIISWIQIAFGVITALGFCHKDHLGQCLAHGIMGSSFVLYGTILTVMMTIGQLALAKTGYSQEFFDSSIITLWGIVNTFTEHRWGQEWNHGDYQHTSMGIVWWCSGMVGILLSWKRKKLIPGKGIVTVSPRNHFPAIIILLTGYAMSVHYQHLEISTRVHAVFGYTLMAAGVTRIIEISFILKDKPAPAYDDIKVFQYLPPFFLLASGILFMGATEEQMAILDAMGIDHSSYVLVLFSFAFLTYFYVLSLIKLWLSISPKQTQTSITNPQSPQSRSLNGFSRNIDATANDVDEFELDSLMHEDEETNHHNDDSFSLESENRNQTGL